MIGIGGLVVWYLCTLVFWAFQPLVVYVPVGVDYNRKTPQEISVRVECTRSSAAAAARRYRRWRPSRQGPALPPLVLPTSRARSTARERALFVLDTVVRSAASASGVARRAPIWRASVGAFTQLA
jgi:hypothetical protein